MTGKRPINLTIMHDSRMRGFLEIRDRRRSQAFNELMLYPHIISNIHHILYIRLQDLWDGSKGSEIYKRDTGTFVPDTISNTHVHVIGVGGEGVTSGSGGSGGTTRYAHGNRIILPNGDIVGF